MTGLLCLVCLVCLCVVCCVFSTLDVCFGDFPTLLDGDPFEARAGVVLTVLMMLYARVGSALPSCTPSP